MTTLRTDIRNFGPIIAARLQAAYLLNRLPGTCWAMLVCWAMLDGRLRDAWHSTACRADLARTGGGCFCGKVQR